MAFSVPLSTQETLFSSRPQSLMRAVLFMALAIIALIPHFLLTAGLGAVGLVWLVLLTGIALLVSYEFAFALLVVNFFLQNAFIAASIPLIEDPDHFRLMLGSNVVSVFLTSIVGIPIWMRVRKGLTPETNALMRWLTYFCVVIVAYTALGFVVASSASAITYMRIYFVGFLMLVIGIAFGFRMDLRYILNITRVLAGILIVWGVVEFFFPYDLYRVFRAVDFLNYKLIGFIDVININGIAEYIRYETNSYLNLSGSLGLDIDLLRPRGPNFHSISYAYALVFCCLIGYIYRFRVVMWGCLPLIFLVGAKGPLIMAVATLLLAWSYGRRRNTHKLMTMLAVALGVYAVVGILYGMYTQDYHVTGFLGGVRGFLHNPLGHGIGVGGNMSSAGEQETLADFQYYQNYGADYGFESAIGVMLYQLGIGSVVFFIFYARFWKSVWRLVTLPQSDTRLIVVPIALAFLIANGIFQEEAFSPAGWGPWLMFSGFLLAQHWRSAKTATVVK